MILKRRLAKCVNLLFGALAVSTISAVSAILTVQVKPEIGLAVSALRPLRVLRHIIHPVPRVVKAVEPLSGEYVKYLVYVTAVKGHLMA